MIHHCMSTRIRRFLLILCCLTASIGVSLSATGKTPVLMWFHGATPEVGTWAADFARSFNATNPDIDLDLNVSSGLRREQLVVTTAAGVGPDIFTDSANVLGMHVQSKIAASLNPFLNRMRDRNDLHPEIMRDLVFGGNTYALPINMYPIVDLYNLDLFRASGVSEPSSWNEMLSAASKLTRVDSNTGIQVYGYHTDTADLSIGIQLHTKMSQLGKPLIGPDDTKLAINHDQGRKAAEYLHDLWEAGMPGVISGGKKGRGYNGSP